jgi:hypothetical protein
VDETALSSLLDAFFEFLCERRVGELLVAARLLDQAVAVGNEERLGRLLGRLWAPARRRLLERARTSSRRLEAWLPEPARQALAGLLAVPAPIPASLVDELVASAAVRQTVRQMLEETVANLVSRAFAVTPGGRSVRGVLGWGARAAGGLLGGLGDELEARLQERLREVLDHGVAMVLLRLAERLKSPETAALLGRRRRALFVWLCQGTEADAGRYLELLPHSMLDALVPVAVAHNLGRDEVRRAVAEEIQAALEELGREPLGALLRELGLYEQARQGMQAQGRELLAAFLRSPQLARWRGSSS